MRFPALPDFEPGWVWLVGAGPGDPGLLTALALKALAEADVVVYDALVDERTLALAHPAAVREFAGKRGGRPSPKQPDISQRLIRLAREGKRVLRLKGGDPFVFAQNEVSRGVEERDRAGQGLGAHRPGIERKAGLAAGGGVELRIDIVGADLG